MGSVLSKWGAAIIAVAVSMAALAGQAAAQSTCFPIGGMGVPGQPGLPDWWGGTAPFDDPRWLASYAYSHNTAKMSAMLDTTGGQKSLVLKWEVRPDPGIAGVGDRLFVGFFNPTTTDATILLLTRDANVTTTGGAPAAGVMSVSAWTRTGTSGLWTGGAAVPAQVTATARLDVTCDGGFPAICDKWAMRVRIPTTAAAGGIELGDVFKMWFELDVEHGGTTDRAKFPAGTVTANETAFPSVFPEPTGAPAWNDVRIGGVGACTAGVELLTHSDIYVGASAGNTEIDLNNPNTFHARPINHTAQVFNPNSIKAHFRMADWGSAVGDSPRWIDVPSDAGFDCLNATGSGAPGSIAAGTGVFDLTCQWTLTAGQRCAYRPDLDPGCTPDPGPRYRHQCITAALSTNGSPVPFARDSYWNNFNFGPASKLERNARLDIGTLTPRDVYVYVMASNMPAEVPQEPGGGEGGEGGEGGQAGNGGEGGNNNDGAGDNRGRERNMIAPALRKRIGKITPGRVTEKEAQELRAMIAAGQLTYDELATIMPTYAAYVWHDTGIVEKSPTGTSKVLESQPSFTLFVTHDGPLYGWKHGLEGVGGVTVTEVSRNFYRIAVGPSGSVEVKTVVEAIEDPCVVHPEQAECKPCEKDANGEPCKKFCVANKDHEACNPCTKAPEGAECKARCATDPKPAGCPACKYPLCLELWQWLVIVLLVAILLAWLLRKRG